MCLPKSQNKYHTFPSTATSSKSKRHIFNTMFMRLAFAVLRGGSSNAYPECVPATLWRQPVRLNRSPAEPCTEPLNHMIVNVCCFKLLFVSMACKKNASWELIGPYSLIHYHNTRRCCFTTERERDWESKDLGSHLVLPWTCCVIMGKPHPKCYESKIKLRKTSKCW